MQIIIPRLDGDTGIPRPFVSEEVYVRPHSDLGMAVGKREAARAVMVRGRLVNPVAGGGTGIDAEPAVINAHRVFIDEDQSIGISQY
jgi:hypothetical protein